MLGNGRVGDDEAMIESPVEGSVDPVALRDAMRTFTERRIQQESEFEQLADLLGVKLEERRLPSLQEGLARMPEVEGELSTWFCGLHECFGSEWDPNLEDIAKLSNQREIVHQGSLREIFSTKVARVQKNWDEFCRELKALFSSLDNPAVKEKLSPIMLQIDSLPTISFDAAPQKMKLLIQTLMRAKEIVDNCEPIFSEVAQPGSGLMSPIKKAPLGSVGAFQRLGEFTELAKNWIRKNELSKKVTQFRQYMPQLDEVVGSLTDIELGARIRSECEGYLAACDGYQPSSRQAQELLDNSQHIQSIHALLCVASQSYRDRLLGLIAASSYRQGAESLLDSKQNGFSFLIKLKNLVLDPAPKGDYCHLETWETKERGPSAPLTRRRKEGGALSHRLLDSARSLESQPLSPGMVEPEVREIFQDPLARSLAPVRSTSAALTPGPPTGSPDLRLNLGSLGNSHNQGNDQGRSVIAAARHAASHFKSVLSGVFSLQPTPPSTGQASSTTPARFRNRVSRVSIMDQRPDAPFTARGGMPIRFGAVPFSLEDLLGQLKKEGLLDRCEIYLEGDTEPRFVFKPADDDFDHTRDRALGLAAEVSKRIERCVYYFKVAPGVSVTHIKKREQKYDELYLGDLDPQKKPEETLRRVWACLSLMKNLGYKKVDLSELRVAGDFKIEKPKATFGFQEVLAVLVEKRGMDLLDATSSSTAKSKRTQTSRAPVSQAAAMKSWMAFVIPDLSGESLSRQPSREEGQLFEEGEPFSVLPTSAPTTTLKED